MTNHIFPFGQSQPFKETHGLLDRQTGNPIDRLVPHLHSQALRLKPGTLALRTGVITHIAFYIFPHILRISLPVPAHQVIDHTLKGCLKYMTAPLFSELVCDFSFAGAKKDYLQLVCCQLIYWSVYIKSISRTQINEGLKIPTAV